MRRQARRIRRGGMQPMMFISGDGQFPDSAAVLVLRWAWRYRSELAPLAAIACILGLTWRLHTACPHWWGLILGLAILAAWTMVVSGAKIGLPALIERLYLATTVLLTGGWMAAATAWGAFTTPLPQVLAVGGLALSVPWWAHGRRRAKVKVERTLQAWPNIAREIGLAGSQVMSAMVDVWGWRARLRLARGQTIADVIAKIPALESGWASSGAPCASIQPPTTWPTGASCGSSTPTRTPMPSRGPAPH
jgi:hypothetical protein